MLFDNLKCPFLTYINQNYQIESKVHLLGKIYYMSEGTSKP